MKVDSLGDSGDLDSINQKAKDIKKEAEDLLNKASKGIEQLRSEYMKLLSVFNLFVRLATYRTLQPLFTI